MVTRISGNTELSILIYKKNMEERQMCSLGVVVREWQDGSDILLDATKNWRTN